MNIIIYTRLFKLQFIMKCKFPSGVDFPKRTEHTYNILYIDNHLP